MKWNETGSLYFGPLLERLSFCWHTKLLISCKIWAKNVIGQRRGNTCILLLRSDSSWYENSWSTEVNLCQKRSVAIYRAFDIKNKTNHVKLIRIHLTKFSKSGLFVDNSSSMYLYVKLNRDAHYFAPMRAAAVSINSCIERCRLEIARAQSVTIVMLVIGGKTFPAKLRKYWRLETTAFGPCHRQSTYF